jgi:hypothetical protein
MSFYLARLEAARHQHRMMEAVGWNGVAASAAGALMDAADSQAVAGPMVTMRFLPKPTTVSGCRRLGASLPAGDGTTNQVVCLPSPEEVVVPPERDDMEFVVYSA